jgi:tetratricopeptide (TPR) repeat protein
MLRKKNFRKILYCICCCLLLFNFSCSRQKEKNPNAASAAEDTTATGKEIAALTEKINGDIKNADLLHARAKLYITKQDFQFALDDMLKATKLDSSKALYYLTLSDIYFATNKTFYAKSALEKSLALDPSNVEANMKLAEIYFIVKKYNDAMLNISEALKKDPSNVKAFFMMGMIYKETGDTAKAISSFQTAIDKDQSNYNAYMQLGILYEAKNNPLALQYFNGALKLKPASEEALYGRGLYYQDHDDLDKAIQDYTTIVQIDPKNAHAHFNLGYIHYNYLKVYDQAIKHYDDAINANPDYAEAYYNRGLCYEALGNIANAKQDYDKALSLRSGYELALKGLERLKK